MKRSTLLTGLMADQRSEDIPKPSPLEAASFGLRLVRIGIAMFIVLISPAIGQEIPAIDADSDGILFSIGAEDSSRHDYRQYGWSGISQYECSIGVDCQTGFPSHLHVASLADRWDGTAVVRTGIMFNLGNDLENVTLRLVRAGVETIAVRLDDGLEFEVRSDMMVPESHEAGFGGYDLELGPLEEGIHRIELSVIDDGRGNGRFGWDAIVLMTDTGSRGLN